MWIKVIPNDTLFFRTGRPFSMGAETWAEPIFPPYPSTVYGAIRTFLIFHRGGLKEFKEKRYRDIGIPEIEKVSNDKKIVVKPGTMRVTGPFLLNLTDNSVYFPIPLDIVEIEDKTNKEKFLTLTRIKKPKVFYTDENLKMLPQVFVYKGEEQVEQPEGYFDEIEMKEYLSQSKNEFILNLRRSEVLKFELKIGIARNYLTLTSEPAHLYRVPMIRLKKEFGFLVRVEGVENMPDKGIFQLGGEGKTVYYERINEGPLQNLENLDIKLSKMFKIYLATHAIFENGWIPKWINKHSMEGEKDGIKIRLVGCLIGKYVRVGGWDMLNSRPKPMFKAVPAGSVYYFEILDDSDIKKIKNIFHFKNISDKYPEEGFGLSLVGGAEL